MNWSKFFKIIATYAPSIVEAVLRVKGSKKEEKESPKEGEK